MIMRNKQSWSRFILSLIILFSFTLSGCNQDNDTSSTHSQDQQGPDGNYDQSSNVDDDTTSVDAQTQDGNGNQPPKAKITAPQVSTSGQTITLNGGESTDPDDNKLSYQWTQTKGPSITLSDNTSSSLTLIAPSVAKTTTFSFKLTVNDGMLSNSATVSVQISPIADNSGPSIVSKSPQANQVGVSTNTKISVGFDEALLEASVDSQSVSLSQNGNSVSSIVSYDSADYIITIKPASPVTPDTTYTVTLANTIKDIDGNAFAGQSWSFTTASEIVADGKCTTAEEGNSLMLSCPTGQVITQVTFASYGNPDGSCGSFTTGLCNASNSEMVVSNACKGENSCTLVADSETFGNPCEGTSKKLAAQVACGMVTDSDTDPDTDTDKPLPKHWHESGGFGTNTKGGLGGEVYKVTNLNNSGAGSFRDAVSAGNRLVVFEVGGVIDLEENDIDISSNNITIAGQTAPHPGISLLRGNLSANGKDIVISHITIQLGTVSGENDTSNIRGDNVVFDHVGVYWARDENLSIHGVNNVTLYKCIIAEGLQYSGHEDVEHSKGSLINKGVKRLSLIGNLYAHNALRNPRVDGGEIFIANDVVYNWAPGWDHRGPHADPDNPVVTDDWFNVVMSARLGCNVSMVGSVGLQGPESVGEYLLAGHYGRSNSANGYVEDNIIKDQQGNDLTVVDENTINVLDSPAIWPEGMEPLPAHEALYEVMRTAGPRPGNRNFHNDRLVRTVADGNGAVIDSQEEVGGFPTEAGTSRLIEVPDDKQARQEWLDALEDEMAVDRKVDLSRLYNMVGSEASDKLK